MILDLSRIYGIFNLLLHDVALYGVVRVDWTVNDVVQWRSRMLMGSREFRFESCVKTVRHSCALP